MGKMRLVEDEVIDNEEVRDEVVANKENEGVVMDENVVENLPDDIVECGNYDKEVKTTDEIKENEEVVMDENVVENIPGGAANDNVNESVGGEYKSGPKHDEKEQEGDYEEEQEGVDEEENIIFMRTWLMEHGGYKQEDTQEWGSDKLKEEMNKVEIEIAMHENIKLEERKKSDNLETRLRAFNIKSLKVVDLLIIPMLLSDHYYVLSFNLRDGAIDLLDNSAFKQPFNKGYNNAPELLKKTVCAYLDNIGCNISKTMEMSEIKRVEMTWRMLNNKVDCGIFAMRHMETFTGETTW
ncbi:hypothetical protein L1987_59891 [Smallanthus sonchifolius]|uniref:Uncharacterized protein n=1 Tax=Smallanthus sonchifolius TaxID=185202 RepID=A0ACB9D7B6_9ASTR|nr:hypothetical protein L1987_59891 [Smallanthus sonchifolius]